MLTYQQWRDRESLWKTSYVGDGVAMHRSYMRYVRLYHITTGIARLDA